MDLLNRRTSTSSRRGTLIPGGGRRNTSSIANGPAATGNAPAATTATTAAKTQLLAEFRAQEEEEAARVLQRAVRGFLGRRFVVRLLLQVYRRQYDPIERQYYYINTATNETTWEKPHVLRLFMDEHDDVPVLKPTTNASELSTGEAARRIQRQARAYLARQTMHTLVRENYMKLFNTETKTYYYLNTRTGETCPSKPLFLGKDDTKDLPVETFQFRKAVCKVASRTNLYGSGVLGFFSTPGSTGSTKRDTEVRPWLCLLSDAKTLPDLETASTAHVLCNFTPDGSTVPFQVPLSPTKFFACISLEMELKPATTPHPPVFALCAVDREAFETVAGTNLEPLKLEMNDRKMGCAVATSGGSVQLQDTVEIVGHPHGKPRVVHTRRLLKMLPHSIAPLKMQFDKEMESGSAGCAVFTRAGKLLGLQHFTPLKDAPPTEFYYIRPILDAATKLVTPPEPFLLTTCLASHEVHVCWSIVRWFKPLPGLAIEYELEICRPQVQRHQQQQQQIRKTLDRFESVYRGPHKSKYIGNLQSDTLYSVRVRAVNAIAKSPWSHVLKFVTLPPPSLAWRITKYCSSIKEACEGMRRHIQDAEAQLRAVQWMAAYVERQLEEHQETTGLETVEMAFVETQAVELVLETVMTLFPEHQPLVLAVVQLLTMLAKLQRRVQRILSQVHCLETILSLLQRHFSTKPPNQDGTTTKDADDQPVRLPSVENDNNGDHGGMAIATACVALLGAILDGDNTSAQQAAQAAEMVPTLVSLLSVDTTTDSALATTLHDAPFVAECVFCFARYTHNHSHSGKWQFVETQGLRVLRDNLEAYATSSSNSSIIYWTLITLGNIAYASDDAARQELEIHTNDLGLIQSVCRARMLFLVRVNETELAIAATQREFTQLAASVMGDEMRNEMDACEHAIHALTHGLEELRSNGDVAQAGDFSLRYLLTDDQRRVQLASQRLMKKFLLRQSAMAFEKWAKTTVFERNCAIFRNFVTTVRHKQLSAAFRRWESAMRELRRHHKSVVHAMVAGSGLAMDLNKKKRERYRMLVLQK